MDRCRDDKADNRKISCLVEKDIDQNGVEKSFTTRFYDINVVATDTTGNAGDVTCTVAVVPEYHYPNSKYSKNAKKGSRERALKPASGKGAPPSPHTPTNDLILELALSKQRFFLDEYELVWDTGLDEGLTTPAPTAAPTSKGAKSSKSSKG